MTIPDIDEGPLSLNHGSKVFVSHVLIILQNVKQKILHLGFQFWERLQLVPARIFNCCADLGKLEKSKKFGLVSVLLIKL